MTLGNIAVVLCSLILSVSPVLAQSATRMSDQRPSCGQVLKDAATDGAPSEICAGDDAARLASAAQKGSQERERHLKVAAGHYRRAATVASKPDMKVLALNVLAGVYDASHLNDAKAMEGVLREIIAVAPEDIPPVFRLAKLQEDEGLIDAAEQTLLDAKRHQPDVVEPYRMLTQFFARRVTALHKQQMQTEAPRPNSNVGEPDANGVYRIGGSLPTPQRADVPHFPPDARAAGVAGAVVAEIVVDASGNVTDATIVNSIPLLDDEALRVVRNWHYAPTMVNGAPTPVRMNVVVNFTLQ